MPAWRMVYSVSDVPVIVGTFAAKLPTVKPCGAGRGRARPRVRRASAVCAGRRRRPGWHRAGTRVGDWSSTPSARRPVSTPFSAVANRSAIPASPVTISATNAELLARAVVTVGRRAPGTVLAGRRVPRRCRWWRTWRFVCWKAAAVSTPKIVGAHRNQLAVVYCGSRRSRRSASGESMMRQYGLVEITNASAASGRFSSGTIATAISAGPGQRCSAWPATAPTPACPLRDGIGAVPGHHRLRLLRQADAHQLQTAISAPPTSAPAAPRATTPTCRSVAAATTDELAARLNAVGLTTGTRAPFDVKAVTSGSRHDYHIPAPNPLHRWGDSVAEAAHRLGCSVSVVYDWIKTGKLSTRRGTGNRQRIPWTEHVEAQCGRRITESGHLNPLAAAPNPAPDADRSTPCRCRRASSLRKTNRPTQLHLRREHPDPRLQEGQYETSVPRYRGRRVNGSGRGVGVAG